MDNVMDSFRGRGRVEGGMLFLPREVALEVIEAARLQNIPVLGVDSFIVTDTYTEPIESADFTTGGANPRDRDSWSDARVFINGRTNRRELFEVVLQKS